ncbi:MAG TPA: hypothetical protein VFF02_19980 [Anaeromyxobacteraceae bacterium]|nr:hypothetical protein [Anaeromyxobacteraceae bacterium]
MAAEGPTSTATPDAPFGPGFFLGQLRAFARDRCPDPGEGLPAVQIHLATGDVFDLCHVVGLGRTFVVLAVLEGEGEPRRMRTELVPYQLVVRVTIREAGGRGHVGFDVDHAPRVLPAGGSLTPESALERTAGESGEACQVLGRGPALKHEG